ncbi:MAG: heme exporter protein CcmD [Kangiella sp.]|nr:MAG: heme exporter protein CcmD [Kangiella sp.]PHS19934.1 MAG: heme exporter protein CcmD [Kangiella sp.]
MMYFETFESFIEMGGHGLYIWLCYGIVSFSLIGYYFISAKSTAKAKQELKRFYARLDAQNQVNE